MTETALASLYGGKPLAGNVGGQKREQEVWTPDNIVEIARSTMGSIELDPCAASSFDGCVTNKVKRKGGTVYIDVPTTGGWFADLSITAPGGEGLRKSPHGGTVVSADSLQIDWDARSTFVNEPFDDLETWLRKVVAEAAKATTRQIVMIGPFRTHRSWFPGLIKTAASLVTLHYNVKFKGHLNAVPFPLFLASWNCVIPDLGSMETGRW